MKLALIGAAALVAAAASVTPALAQAVISDPGYCAQFYPNANCQNLGAGNPYTNGGLLAERLAERQRVHGTSLAAPPQEAPRLSSEARPVRDRWMGLQQP